MLGSKIINGMLKFFILYKDKYVVDLIFEYMDNTLVQISEDFHIKYVYYDEEEIWYVV